MSLLHCTVCHTPQLSLFQVVDNKTYWRCDTCQATLMDPAHWLPAAEERAIYDLHDNNPADPGYRRFLAKLAEPLLACVPPGSQGLDFGCGPGAALADMLRAEGMDMTVYDPFYAPDPTVLTKQYDFITCTEVLEHLHQPLDVLRDLERMLKPGAMLAIMTCFQTDDSRFAHWHYRRDPTHVVFYRQTTLQWLADYFGWQLSIPRKDVALFQCQSGGAR